MRRNTLRLGMVTAAVVAFSMVMPSAFAVLPECGQANHIFVRSTANRPDTRGSANTSLVRTRDLDNDCQGIAFSTAHIAQGLPGSGEFDHQVEMGWQRIRTADNNIRLCEFWEKQVDALVTFDNSCGGNTSLSYGNTARFRISNVAGTNQWQPAINYLNGGPWHDRGDPLGTTYDRGFAMGETEAKGGETSMLEDQTNLEYFKVVSGGTDQWVDYPGVNCIVDETSSWSWHRVLDNSYTVTHVSNTCN